jgi:hypothetical protein
MDILEKWWFFVLSDEDLTIGEKVLELENHNRIFIDGRGRR